MDIIIIIIKESSATQMEKGRVEEIIEPLSDTRGSHNPPPEGWGWSMSHLHLLDFGWPIYSDLYYPFNIYINDVTKW